MVEMWVENGFLLEGIGVLYSGVDLCGLFFGIFLIDSYWKLNEVLSVKKEAFSMPFWVPQSTITSDDAKNCNFEEFSMKNPHFHP